MAESSLNDHFTRVAMAAYYHDNAIVKFSDVR